MKNMKIYPIPQSMAYGSGSFVLSSANVSITSGASEATRRKIEEILKKAGVDATFTSTLSIDPGKTNIVLAIKGDNDDFTNYSNGLEPTNDGYDSYVLNANDNKITIVGQDAAALFYGVVTLGHMLDHSLTIQNVLINDFADTKVRGVVEGFYGIPWSYETRKNMIKMMGRMKMNSFVYAPKDDPYHFGADWATPYPDDLLSELAELAELAKLNHVSFVWTTHVSEHMDFLDADDAFNATRTELTDRQWIESDRAGDFPLPKGQHHVDSYSQAETYDKLFTKLEQLYSAGVRQFGFLIDDIDFPLARFGIPVHVQASNKVVEWGEAKGDVLPLMVCPAYYYQQDIAYNGYDYMRTIKGDPHAPPIIAVPKQAPGWEGEEVTIAQPGLHESVQVMYTGRHVMSDVKGEHNHWFFEHAAFAGTPAPDGDPKGYGLEGVRRQPLIWWNYPVTDYDGNIHLLLGPTPVSVDEQGNVLQQALCPSAKGTMEGVLSNPMQQGHLSEIALFGTGDYTWNADAFDPIQSWKDSFRHLYPNVAESMYIFAKHNQRRKGGAEHMVNHNQESFELRPFLDAFANAVEQLDKANIQKSGAALINELKPLETAAADIKQNGSALLLHDIKPWIEKCVSVCSTIKLLANMYNAYMENDVEKTWKYYSLVQAEKLGWAKITAPQLGGASAVIEIGTHYIKPFVDALIEKADKLMCNYLKFAKQPEEKVRPAQVYTGRITTWDEYNNPIGVHENHVADNLLTESLTSPFKSARNQRPSDTIHIVYDKPYRVYDLALYSHVSDHIGFGELQILTNNTWQVAMDIGKNVNIENHDGQNYNVERITFPAEGVEIAEIKLIITTAKNCWMQLNSLRLNEQSGYLHGIIPTTSLEQGGWAQQAADGKPNTAFRSSNDEDALTYNLADNNKQTLLILQNASAANNAAIKILASDKWQDLGTLNKAYNAFDISTYKNITKVEISWTKETSPLMLHGIL